MLNKINLERTDGKKIIEYYCKKKKYLENYSKKLNVNSTYKKNSNCSKRLCKTCMELDI